MANTIDMPDCNDALFDDVAFEVLFKECFTPLCNYCQFKFDFELDMAKDMVHNAFMRLWENRLNLSKDLNLKAYLYRIVTNISLDQLRHQGVQRKHISYASHEKFQQKQEDDFSFPDVKLLANDIDRAIEELPEQMRRVFELSRNEGLKYAEIAERLQISVKTVETQMGRALAKLRQKLAAYLVIMILIILVRL